MPQKRNNISKITPHQPLLFSRDFINKTLQDVKDYNVAPARGKLHYFYNMAFGTRKLPNLEQQLFQVETPEDCFNLLTSLATTEQKINSKGFTALVFRLQKSIVAEFIEETTDALEELIKLGRNKHKECKQHINNHDCALDHDIEYDGPKRSELCAIEAVVSALETITNREIRPRKFGEL